MNKLEKRIEDKPYTSEKSLIQSSKKRKNYEPIKEETPDKDTRNDSNLAFNFVSDHINFSDQKHDPSTQRLQRTPNSRILYAKQIVYGLRLLPKATNI